MITQMFTVFDSKAEAYLPPFYMHTVGEAKRSFADTCNNTEHQFYRHSGDYTLFHIGSFNDAACTVEMLKALNNLGTASTFIVNPE